MKLRLLAAIAVFPVLAFAQTAPPPSTANLLKNGDFARFSDEDNLWDGVDHEGFLAGDVSREDAPIPQAPSYDGMFFAKQISRVDAILDSGNIGKLPIPISVQVADFNRDGLLDIITLDGAGYFRVYFNLGTPKAPKFTHCEFIPLYLGRFPWKAKNYWIRRYDDGLRLALGDFDKTGTQDLLLGNYYGDLMLIKNTGTPQVPEWKQPSSPDAIKIPTTRDGSYWANLFAPATCDWNRDGKLDVLVGEGSYSANAVHLLLNTASGFGAKVMPAFNEDMREYLAYGDGREQLAPAVVDYNGDGNPDLLVGDRSGNINVYLSSGPWKKGDELQRQPQPISFGGQTSIGAGNPTLRCVSPAVADLNGDGKFDILIGKPNGRIAFSYNIGTATEPKFGPLNELKGEKIFPRGTMRHATDWGICFGYQQGNFYATYNCVSPQEDPEAAQATGPRVLKFSYHLAQNRFIRKAPMALPGSAESMLVNMNPAVAFNHNLAPIYWGESVNYGVPNAAANTAIIRQQLPPNTLTPNGRYMLSFKVKGRNVRDGRATLFFGGWLIRDVAAASANTGTPDTVCEALKAEVSFNAGPVWATVTKPLTFRFNAPDLNQPEKWKKQGSKIDFLSMLDIRATVNAEDGVFYIDDVKITPM